jgi:hypothetical protein
VKITLESHTHPNSRSAAPYESVYVGLLLLLLHEADWPTNKPLLHVSTLFTDTSPPTTLDTYKHTPTVSAPHLIKPCMFACCSSCCMKQ